MATTVDPGVLYFPDEVLPDEFDHENGVETSEFVESDEQLDLCPECRHLWTDDGPIHYADCRYYYVDLQEPDEE